MSEPTFTLKQLADALAGVSQAEATKTPEAPKVAEGASPQYVTKSDLDSFKSELLESLQGSNPTPATPVAQDVVPASQPQITLPVAQPNQVPSTGNVLVDQYYKNIRDSSALDVELNAMLKAGA